MGLFKKKDKKKEIPSLPELPRLPEFPRLEDEETPNLKKTLPQLPGFSSNSPQTKFSQDSIKDAVTGEKEGIGGSKIDEFDTVGDLRMIEGPLKKPLVEEMPFEDTGYEDLGTRTPVSKIVRREVEPVFIRIDKFEESLRIFEETKKKISDIERILGETKRIKEKEEKELQDWENEIRTIKNQIEKIDHDIFSKI